MNSAEEHSKQQRFRQEQLERERELIEERQDLRDRVAIAAMSGLLSNHAADLSQLQFERIGMVSYRIADAMLEARQKTQEDQSEGTQP